MLNFLKRPVFVGIPFRLASACLLEYSKQYSDALNLLEEVISLASPDGSTLLLALTYERAGRLVKKWTKNDRLSRTFLIKACQTYRDFGADAKCLQMETQYSSHTLFSPPSREPLVSVPDHNPSDSQSGSGSSGSQYASTSESVDLAALLSAVATWQQETSASRVAASLISILIKSMVRELPQLYVSSSQIMYSRVQDMVPWH